MTKTDNDLLSNLDKLHTTELGVIRIKKNLSLENDDIVDWCREKIKMPESFITRSGKNWYIQIDKVIITVNAHSYTIITAHKKKKGNNAVDTVRNQVDYKSLKVIDMQGWNRREIFEYFKNTSLNVTVQIDITDYLHKVKERNCKFYPSIIHCIAKVVNENEEYRYGRDKMGNIGIWDVIHPLYTVPRKNEPSLFTMASTTYNTSFDDFYQCYLSDYSRAEHCSKMLADESFRPNLIGITAAPGLRFTSLSFGGSDSKKDLTPFLTLGKYENKDGVILLPISGEFSHAVNDGNHITAFFEKLEETLQNF